MYLSMENQEDVQYPTISPSRLTQKSDDALHNGSLHPRLAWMMAYRETGNAQAVCNRFGISRKTFYKWLKRPEHVELLRRVRDETGFGQRRLRAYLEEKYRVSLSERTIWKLLKREPEDAGALAGQG